MPINKTNSYSSALTPRFHSPLGPTFNTSRPSFGQSIKEGLGFGIGASIARNFFESRSSSPSVPLLPPPKDPLPLLPLPDSQQQTLSTPSPRRGTKSCSDLEEKYQKCIEQHQNVEKCQDLLNAFNSCSSKY